MLKTKSGKTASKAGIAGFQGARLSIGDVEEIIENLTNINLIELTENQGITEEALGSFMDRIDRENFFIMTESKKRTGATFEDDFEKSLVNLKTDYIDLCEFRNVKEGFDYLTLVGEGGGLEKAVELKEAGKLNYIGVSTRSLEIARDLSIRDDVDKIMVPYNPAEVDRTDIYKELAENSLLVGVSPMGGGMSDKYQELVNFSLYEDFLAHVIFRVKNKGDLEKLKELIDKCRELTDVEKNSLIEEYKGYEKNFCRQCGGCFPCTVGMNIVRNLEINRELKKGNYKVIEDFEDLPKNARDCIKCGACELKCPYDVPVRELHKETVRMVEKIKDGNS